MKKLSKIYKKLSLLNLCLILILSSCATSKKNEETDYGNSNQESSQLDSKKAKKEAKKAKKAEKEAKKAEKNGQNYSVNHPIENDIGIIRLRAIPDLGSFNICALTEKDKAIPVLSSTNEYTSSSFYLYTEKKIYKLTASSGVSTKASKTDKGMEIDYEIKNVAGISVNFDCFSSVEDVNSDMVKITAVIENLSQRKSKYALRAVLDTVLGESYRNHFYTSDGLPVKNEKQFSSNAEDASVDRWIISKNANVALQIFMNGGDTSKIEQVQLANFSTLDTKNWYPNLTSYRAFDTVTAYNNSAVGINWPITSIAPGEKKEIIFYMALALDEQMPNGAAFLYPQEFVESSVVDNAASEEGEQNDPFAGLSVPKKEQDTETRNSIVVEKPRVTVNKVVEPSDAVDVPKVDFDVSSLSAEQLEPEYIQNLINRITVLEESGLAVNRAELLELNAELDAILEILRKN